VKPEPDEVKAPEPEPEPDERDEVVAQLEALGLKAHHMAKTETLKKKLAEAQADAETEEML
jgi:hypothetical protein